MMTITQALRTAARLLGRSLDSAAAEAGVRPDEFVAAMSAVDAVDRMLIPLGLRLAVVPQDRPILEVNDQAVLAAAEAAHTARGERGVRTRLAALMRVDRTVVERVMTKGSPLGGADRGKIARDRLWEHRLHPERMPLPPFHRNMLAPEPTNGEST
jgi:hypothetical protein